jgi:UDP-glucose 4-epimerase
MVPSHPRLVFQAVHSLDVGDAYRLAIVRDDARGAYNIAAEPVLNPPELGRILGARPVRVPASLLRLGADLTWRLRLQPTSPGWVDMALAVPIMDTTRARTELGWSPRHTAADALLELIEGMREGAGEDTPPLSPQTTAPARVREVLTGVGRTSR